MKHLIIKTFIILVSTGLAGGVAIAQRPLVQTDQQALMSQEQPTPIVRGQARRPITKTDIDGVYNSGQVPVFGEKVSLVEGRYDLGELTYFGKNEYCMLVQVDQNDPDKIIAVVVPSEIRRNARRTRKENRRREKENQVALPGYQKAYLFQGRPVLNGTKIMLTNLGINEWGDIEVESTTREDASHIMITLNQTRGGRELILSTSGENPHPMLSGASFIGAKYRGDRKPQLGLPKNGFFGGKRRAPEVLLNGGSMIVGDKQYELIPMNGAGGAVVSLTSMDFNTMGEFVETTDEIQRMVSFVKGAWREDVIFDMRPTHVPGQFDVRYVTEKDLRSGFAVIGDAFAGFFQFLLGQ